MAGDFNATPKCYRRFRNLNEKKRRDQFNMLLNELSVLVCSGDSRKVDKTTVLEQALQFLEHHKGGSHHTRVQMEYVGSFQRKIQVPNQSL